jgi:hypothetical protein
MEQINKEVNAVHERDLDNLLEKIGIKEKFDKNEILCKFCKESVNRNNVYSIFPESGMFNFICANPICINEFLKYSAEKRKTKTENFNTK